MPTPFVYASPEQVMKDRADYARRNIARGKPIVALEFTQGIVLIAENPSAMLHKLSEIYDRVAFAGVGKYDEYERLRILGIRQAELKGFSYSREDVTARSVANLYSQVLGQIFTDSLKPFEVEILVTGVGEDAAANEMYHVTFDGFVSDKKEYTALGGQEEALTGFLKERYGPTPDLAAAVRLGAEALRSVGGSELSSAQLEAAVLDRTLPRRKFRRLTVQQVTEALSGS
jgi:proteasome alpha subunit